MYCNTLQRTAIFCSMMQHTVKHCSKLQHTATKLHRQRRTPASNSLTALQHIVTPQRAATQLHTATTTHWNTFQNKYALQHTVITCIELIDRTATHCNTTTHCNTLRVAACCDYTIAVYNCTTLHHAAPRCTTLHHAAPRCTTLHYTAPPCTTLHNTAIRLLWRKRITCVELVARLRMPCVCNVCMCV